jgi:hypothetical protein
MPKATVTLPSGATVQIEGTTEEVDQLIQFYEGRSSTLSEKHDNRTQKVKAGSKANAASVEVDFEAVSNELKQCDQMELFETKILDKPGGINSVLLPLYFVHEYQNDEVALTSGNIKRILEKLGINLSPSRISHILAEEGAKYVIGNKAKGRTVNYKLSRLGVKYFKEVLTGN